MAAKKPSKVIEVAGREVTVTSPDKPYFPKAGLTKLDLVLYYRDVADGAVRGIYDRPIVLKRYVRGVNGPFFFQKRAPKGHPDWVDTVTLSYPSGRTADEIVVTHPAQLCWIANLGCLDLNPHPTRADDLDHPDELRIDLDPLPGVPWSEVIAVALMSREVLRAHGLTCWPKTSGSKGFHILVRIERSWTFEQVRDAARTLAIEVERRMPGRATARWWKEEREGVFVDYNRNARDQTVASAYSVRPKADARVSAPLLWDEVPDCDPAAYTLKTVPQRFADLGDPHAGIDAAAGSLDSLLALAEEHAREGLTDRPREEHPLRTIAESGDKGAAMAGLERWKARHPEAAKHLEPADVLVDAMRGRFTTWTRIRVNLRHVPEDERPPQEPLDPDDAPNPWAGS